MFIRRVSWTILAFIILAAPVLTGVGSFGAAAHAASSRVAVIKELKGSVKVKKAGGSKEFTAFAKMSLNQGDILTTGTGSSAVLQFANGTEEDDKMTVSANTKLTFSKLSDRNGTTTKVSMWSGSAWADVKSIASVNDEFKLETPTAVMGVRGTHLLVSVDPTTGDTRLIVAAGVVRTETTDSDARRTQDVYPTQRALITDANDEKPGDIYVAPVDLSLLMNQSDTNIVSAILGSAADILDENKRYTEQYTQEGLPEPLGDTPADLNRFKSNTESLLGAIADQALKSGLLTQERLDRIVAEVKEQSGLTIDLNKKQLDITEADKKKQEEQRRLEAEQKKRAEEQLQKELERRSAEEALLKQLEEAKKKQAEANKRAEDEKKKKAMQTYESGLSDAQKAKYEEEKKKREAELNARSPSPSPSSTPSTVSQPVRSNVTTLSDLKINGTSLTGFSANTTSYTLQVSHVSSEVSVTPYVTSGSNATVKVGGAAVASGSATSVSLAPAGSSTVIEIVVTAENGVDKATYRVTANRDAVPVNLPPTDIVLSNPNVYEGTPAGAIISGITAVDPDSAPPFDFDLVSGDGSDDNGSFFIYRDNDSQIYQLAVNDVIDYETKSTLHIRLRAVDSEGAVFEKAVE
ncbi:MAG: cadherin-like beta sandwich domain-containing protein, partial [Cohnella sp.]|nr:cadherin-like beta sandwich domain-containing protein [Cohnella sp.]